MPPTKMPSEQRDEADADVVERHLVVGEAELLEEQAQREVGERVADLVDQHEEQDDERALARAGTRGAG